MSGGAISIQGQMKVPKLIRPQTRQLQRRHRYNACVLYEEPWTRKPSTAYAFLSHENVPEVRPDCGDVDISDNISPERKPQGGNITVIQLKTSDYFKFSEIGFAASTEVLKQYQKAVDDLGQRIEAMIPRLDVNIRKITNPVFSLPKFSIATPSFSSILKLEIESIQCRMRESIAASVAEAVDNIQVIDDSLWLDSPNILLDTLETEGLSDSQVHSAIAGAECLAFSQLQTERLLAIYDGWIEANRFTDDDETITVLCSAIRKYSMNMGSDRYSRYADWLAPSTNERVHQDVELELSKGAYWHIRYVHTVGDDRLRELQTSLSSVATDYLKPRLMLDKNYASTVKFAILGCVLIDAFLGEHEVSRRLWSQKAGLSMGWFDRLVSFELGKAKQSICKRDQGFAQRVDALVDSLNREGE